MNCGRDAKPIESFSRAVAAMPKVRIMNKNGLSPWYGRCDGHCPLIPIPIPQVPTVLYFASGTPHWTPKDCENVTARAVGERPGTSWRGVPLGTPTTNGSAPAALAASAGAVPSPDALRVAADQSDTLRSFAFLKVRF